MAEDPFIAAHAAFLYETPSSIPECPKARIVFVLDEPITDTVDYRTAQEALWSKFGATDSQVKEPARFFYGRVNARYKNLGNILYGDVLQEQVIEPYLDSLSDAGNGHQPAAPIGDKVPEGSRNTTMASIVGSMWQKGISREAITAAAHVQNEQTFEPPMSADEVNDVIASITRKPPGALPVSKPAGSATEGEPNDSGNIEPQTLNFRTAADIAASTPKETKYISKPWVAAGSMTECDGKIKLSGKTTFVLAMARKVLDGLPFMGEPTTETAVVYLTEQNSPSFRAALTRADLLNREDFHVLAYKDTFGTNRPQVVEASARKCKEVSARLLVVDTVPQWAGLQGTSENDSGAALEALAPLQAVARLWHWRYLHTPRREG